jgi:hypothetical protein
MSSYYDDASLMLLASGGAQKDGKVYSVKPTDGSGDFTFTRGSNLSATRVNASQLIEKGRENLLTYSNDFSNAAWLKTSITLTSGQSDKDGGTDAWKFESQSAASFIQQLFSNSGVHTRSFYAKSGNVNWVSINSAGSQKAFFDLQNGVVGTTSTGAIVANIENVGNGWYLCSVAINSQNDFYVFVANTDNSSITNTGEYIYIQDAQLEQGLVATSYIETGASTAQAGILENTPRFDYSGGATCPSLLLEPSRTNLVTQSEYFGDSSWFKGNVVVTPNSVVSPDGAQNGTKVDFLAIANANIQRSPATPTTIGVDYTISFYARADAPVNNVKISSVGGDTNLTITTSWQRFTRKITATATSTATTLVTRDSVATTIYLYGFQLEAGSYATSYIPTYSVSQTRAQDFCGGAGDAATFNSTEGVLYAEIAALADDEINRHITLWDGTDTNRLVLKYDNQSNVVQVFNRVGGVETAFLGHNLADITISHKIAVKYKANDYALVIDGVEVDTDTSSSTWPASVLNNIKFSNGGGSDFYGKTKQLIYFPTALSDLQLAILTGATTYNTFAEMALALNYTVYE